MIQRGDVSVMPETSIDFAVKKTRVSSSSLIQLSASISLILIIMSALISCDDESSGGLASTPATSAGDSSGTPTNVPPIVCVDQDGVGAQEGAECSCGGLWTCVNGRFTCQGGATTNACGGCNELTETVGSPCGTCAGAWACSGLDALTCEGERENNVCGGCEELFGSVGAPCGTCGELTCLSSDELSCIDRPPNACGGCEPIEVALGRTCGSCGLWACGERGEVVCEERDPNVCLVTRLILMGDTGEANEAQYRVAAGAQTRCDRAGGCDGFVMLGDNIYDTGAESAMDQQLTEKIDLPYANLKLGPPPAAGEPDQRTRMPIYVSLGNHDLGGAGLNSAQVQHYLDYSDAQSWFYYPEEFWELQLGQVHLISLHTNPLAYGIPAGFYAPQAELIERVTRGSTAPWKLAFGHHPYRSEGQHGNAGAYEGLQIDPDFLGVDVSGDGFRRWVDENVCNQIDFYVSGHDHNRQWLNSVPLIPNLPVGMGTEPCDTHFAVSGAGAKTKDFVGRGNDVAFLNDREEGFLFMEFYLDRVEVEFCDADGGTEWSRTISRP